MPVGFTCSILVERRIPRAVHRDLRVFACVHPLHAPHHSNLCQTLGVGIYPHHVPVNTVPSNNSDYIDYLYVVDFKLLYRKRLKYQRNSWNILSAL